MTLRTAPAAWTQEFLPLWTAEEVATMVVEHAIAARFNVAPTQHISCIHRSDPDSPRRQWSLNRWGLVPSWADDLTIGNRMINARSETVHEKKSFRSSFSKRRCLIPADGYYEWMKTPDGKQPYLIERSDGGMLAMAGLWAENRKLATGDQPVRSCTVLTTQANDATEKIHDRMPVFLTHEQQDAWLDPNISDVATLLSLLQPASNDLLTTRPVSPIVNNVKNDSDRCVEHYDPPTQMSLF